MELKDIKDSITSPSVYLRGKLVGEYVEIKCKNMIHAKRVFRIINNYFFPDDNSMKLLNLEGLPHVKKNQ